MKKLLLSAAAAVAALTASAADYTVYQNGALAANVNANTWWNCTLDMTAANPAGEGTAFVLSRNQYDDGNFCMGLQTAEVDNTIAGPLHSANLSFEYYATTPCTITVQLGGQASSEQVITVAEGDINKWATATYSVATDFPNADADWNAYTQKGKNDCLLGLIVTNFTAETKVYVNNVVYSNIDTEWVKPDIKVFCPEPPAPAQEQADVVSLLSVYPAATTFGIGGWGQSTQWEKLTAENGAPVGHLTNFNYLGWELAQHIDVTGCDYMHVDVYAMTEGAPFGFTPISPGQEKPYVAPALKAGEWTSLDVPLSHWSNVNFADVFQVKFDQGNGGEYFIANVYFYTDPNAVKPALGNTWYGSTTATATRDGKTYDITIDYALTANENGTLTCVATFAGDEGLEAGHKLHVNSANPAYDSYMLLTYDEATETYTGTTDNTEPFAVGKAFDYLHFWLEYPGGVVGPAIDGYVFGAGNEKPADTPSLRLTASAGNITATGAEISYNVVPSSHFTAADITITIDGKPATDNPVVLTGLTPSTDYTYTIKAVAVSGENSAEAEATVTFRTLRDGASAAVWYGIADGLITNAYYVGEDESMKRSLPVSVYVKASYNPDMTMTFDASVKSEKEIVGIVAPNIVAVSDPRGDNQPDHAPMTGSWQEATYTTTGTYTEGARMAWFTFDIIYAGGGNTNISSLNNKYNVGDENTPVEPGAAASLELLVPSTPLKVGESAPLTALVKDADGHYIFGSDVTFTVSGSAISVEGFTATAMEKGESVITATCGDLTATAVLACAVSADARQLDGTATGDDDSLDYSLAFDKNEGTEVVWSCAETQVHSMVYDLGLNKVVEAVQLVWEGASATEYTVTLSKAAPEAAAMRAPTEQPVTLEVKDGDGGAGKVVRNLLAVPGDGVIARYVTLTTTKAFDAGWGIKLKEMSVLGVDIPGSISSLDADAAAPVEFYNLQGVKVQGELAPGLYIRRQGGNATKVLVK